MRGGKGRSGALAPQGIKDYKLSSHHPYMDHLVAIVKFGGQTSPHKCVEALDN